MFLQECVGQIVYLRLTEDAKQDVTLNMFIDTGNLVGTKLIAVDELGIWLEVLLKTKEPTATMDIQALTSVVLVKWLFLAGVFVPEEPHLISRHIGFR